MKIFDTFKRNLTVERYFNGSWNEETGYFDKGNIVQIVIKASVDPTPADVMLTLPEGYRDTESYTLYTDTELKLAKAKGNISDIVLMNGGRYRVIKVSHWNNTILKHYEVIISKEDVDVD